MGRRPSVDVINWQLYRHAWILVVLAGVVVAATSFRVDEPVPSAVPPTFTNEDAADLAARARAFDEQFPDRRPGTTGDLDSAQWIRGQLEQAHPDLVVRTTPATTTSPVTSASVGLVNVEATLPGRTRELVVVHAHRDTSDAHGRGGDPVGQLALVQLASSLASTRDRRRTYLFVSTDAATLNGAGARAMAERLVRHGSVMAVIGIDRLGSGGEQLHVAAAPSDKHAPPLGLVTAARAAVEAERGSGAAPGLFGQLVELATPFTLHEHGQVIRRGLPGVTISGGDPGLVHGADAIDRTLVGDGVRAVERVLGTIDAVDRLATAGKTYAATEHRVYRGWALKILIATLLVPVWVTTVDMVVRQRRRWNLVAALGTSARATLAGMWAVVALWLVAAVGLFPTTGDHPPTPSAVDGTPATGIVVWMLLAAAGWTIARGPDWRRQRDATRSLAATVDGGELAVGIAALVVISIVALAASPYAVLFAIPALHLWLVLGSLALPNGAARVAVWCAGLGGPVLAVASIGGRFDLGAGAPGYVFDLVQTRTVPPVLALIAGAGAGLALLLLVASTGRVATPLLPKLRTIGRWRVGEPGPWNANMLSPASLRPVVTRLLSRRTSSPLRTRRSDQPDPAVGSGTTDERSSTDRELARLHRATERAGRRRVNSR